MATRPDSLSCEHRVKVQCQHGRLPSDCKEDNLIREGGRESSCEVREVRLYFDTLMLTGLEIRMITDQQQQVEELGQ